MAQITISLVIPVYNEACNLPLLAQRLAAVEDELATRGYEVELTLVDDHSSDGTQELLKHLLAQRTKGHSVRLARNSGSYAAIAAGLRYCTGDCAVVMAADLQDPPELISKLVAKWEEGYEVVCAVRRRRLGESLRTRCLARVYYWLMRRLALSEIPSTGADFLLMDRKVIDAYNAISEKNTSFLAMVLWMGFRQTSIDYVKEARYAGKTKWTLSKKLKLFVDSIASFSYAPIRLMSLLGFVMALCGFIYALVVILGRLTGWIDAGTGFAALMTVLLVGQGTIMMMLGVLGEYLWRTFDEARGRPRYIVEEHLSSDRRTAPRQEESESDESLSASGPSDEND